MIIKKGLSHGSLNHYTSDLRLVGWHWLCCQRWRSHCWSRLRWFHQFHRQNLEGAVESEGRRGTTTVVEHGASTQVRLVKDALTNPLSNVSSTSIANCYWPCDSNHRAMLTSWRLSRLLRSCSTVCMSRPCTHDGLSGLLWSKPLLNSLPVHTIHIKIKIWNRILLTNCAQCNLVFNTTLLIFAPLDTLNCRGVSPGDLEQSIRSLAKFSLDVSPIRSSCLLIRMFSLPLNSCQKKTPKTKKTYFKNIQPEPHYLWKIARKLNNHSQGFF